MIVTTAAWSGPGCQIADGADDLASQLPTGGRTETTRPAGSGSVTLTARATDGPLLVTVTVQTMGSPGHRLVQVGGLADL